MKISVVVQSAGMRGFEVCRMALIKMGASREAFDCLNCYQFEIILILN